MLIRTGRRALLLVALAAVAAACSAGAPDRPARTARTVDSTVPREEALRRFQQGLDPVAALDGPASRDSLVAMFVAAVAARDTTVVRSLMLDRSGFAYLFYPTTPQGLPPYDLSPQLMWDMLTRQSDRGISDAFRRLGGQELTLAGYDCGPEPAEEGDNLVWGPCMMSIVLGTDTLAGRLTGPILERDGRYRFVSYTNDLD